MSARVRPILQSAPERRGVIDAPGLGSWTTSTSIPDPEGTYEGTTVRTYTFEVTSPGTGTIGTTASIRVSWDDGGAGSGVLELGTDVGYVAGSALPVDSTGLSIVFAAGTIVNGETFTVLCTPSLALPRDHTQILSDLNPTTINLPRTSADDRDRVVQTEGAVLRRQARAMSRQPSFSIDYELDVARAAWLKMVHGRHRMTLAENYDRDTIFLLRGGGPQPLIGSLVDFQRTGAAAYVDRDTGLWRLQEDDDVMRVEEGPAGPAFSLSAAVTNQDGRFHPEGDATANVRGWVTHAGAPQFRFDPYVPPVLHPDGGWAEVYTVGTLRVDLDATEAIHSNFEPAINVGENQVAQVYICGRGRVTVEIYEGLVSPLTLIAGATQTVTLDSMEFQRIVVEGVSGITGVKHLRITADDDSQIWISAKQQETWFTASQIVQTTGSSASQSAETLDLRDFTIPWTGTISMWFKLPPGDLTASANPFVLFAEITGANFGLLYDPANTRVRFGLSAAAIMSGTLTGPLASDVWHHIVATWEFAANDEVLMALYVDRVILNSNDLGWQFAADPDVANYAINDSGGAFNPMRNWQIAEFRIDRRAWTLQEVEDQYDRMTDSGWTHLHRETAGRRFWPGRHVEGRVNDVNPDKYILSGQLIEASAEPDSLAVPR